MKRFDGTGNEEMIRARLLDGFFLGEPCHGSGDKGNQYVHQEKPKIALGHRLKGVRNVVTLGVKPNLTEYSPEDLQSIMNARKVYYPTICFAFEFHLMGKEIFPSFSSHYYAGDKIRQLRLFEFMGIHHPRTRIYFPRHYHRIVHDFSFPFVAKIPRGMDSGRGVFLVQDRKDLDEYLTKTKPAYIQEYLAIERDIRVVIIQNRVVLAYWRKSAPGQFLCNVGRGGTIEFGNVPPNAIKLALETSRKCDFNDIGIDMLVHQGQSYVLEVNLRFGRIGFQKAGIDLKEIYRCLLEEGVI